MNPTVWLLKIWLFVWGLAKKTPAWAVKWVIMPIAAALVIGGLFLG